MQSILPLSLASSLKQLNSNYILILGNLDWVNSKSIYFSPHVFKINEIYSARGLFGVFSVIEVNGSQAPLRSKSYTEVHSKYKGSWLSNSLCLSSPRFNCLLKILLRHSFKIYVIQNSILISYFGESKAFLGFTILRILYVLQILGDSLVRDKGSYFGTT